MIKHIAHLLVLGVLLLCNSCHVGRFFIWNFADINDHKKFASMPVEKDSTQIFQFQKKKNQSHSFERLQIPLDNKVYPFEQALEASKTVAFLVIRNDSILYEQYFDKYDSSSIVPSFSMAKSFTSALMGIAIEEGHIHSVKDPITKYLPDLPENPYAAIAIEDLLDMRSGLKFNEGYFNPFGHVAKSYYGTNLRRFSSRLKAKAEAGSTFEYISVNTQLLGWAIEAASGQKLADYLEAKIWKPLGMEFDASWSIDSKRHQMAKAFCCLNARARDFARFGRLYLNRGQWQGQQVLPASWVEASLDFDKTAFYSYQWWRNPASEFDYFAQGFLGQFIYVNPDRKVIIVRLGKKSGGIYWPRLFQQIAQQL